MLTLLSLKRFQVSSLTRPEGLQLEKVSIELVPHPLASKNSRKADTYFNKV